LFLQKEHITVSTKLIWIASFLYTISLVTLLFFRPNVQNEDAINLVPFSTLSIYLSGDVYWLIAFYNLAANVALFIPFGILLKWKTNNYLLLLLVPLLAISTIELSQYLTQRGSLDIDDLFLNTMGFLIGYALTPMFQHIIHLKSVQS
jgi:glycopeptide antibiotics resistance protein